MAVRETVAPSAEPVTLTEAKAHCVVSNTDDDTYIGTLITAARKWVEAFTRRRIAPCTLQLTLDEFPAGDDPLELPFPPLIAVESVAYNDTDGAAQTLDADEYHVDAESAPPRIEPAYGTTWPSTRGQMNDVTITFRCGYARSVGTSTGTGTGTGDGYDQQFAQQECPRDLKQAVLMLVAQWYLYREPVIDGRAPSAVPFSVESICWQHRELEAT